MTWTSAVGRSCKWLLYKIVHGLALTRISPNALTFIGLLINIGAAVLFGFANAENQRRMFLYAGLVIIGAGIFDMVDGRVARATNQVTQFGGFFDSVMDRYSDVALFFGLLVYYARANRFLYVVIAALVMVSSVLVSYARARAESLIPSCKVGFMERPERIVLIIIGALFNRMAPVLWVIAVLSTIRLFTASATPSSSSSSLSLHPSVCVPIPCGLKKSSAKKSDISCRARRGWRRAGRSRRLSTIRATRVVISDRLSTRTADRRKRMSAARTKAKRVIDDESAAGTFPR